MLAPIIVLGLGGVGSDVVTRLERKVSNKDLKGRVLFAVIDTDVNTMDKILREEFEGCRIQISKNMTVKEYLAAHPEYEEWFFTTEGLNIKSMTEGAGQVRAISRLAFDMAVRNGMLNQLEEKMNKVFQLSEQISYQTPRVLIVSSLAGGTGSGIVLPLALYMRRYFEEEHHITSVIIKGMFIMPDVFRTVVSSDFEQISIEANAYAAIKELEAFIKKGEGYLAKRYDAKLKLNLPRKASEQSEAHVTLPYNYCYLFGGKNKVGNGLRGFQDYLEFAVECIYAQAFSPMQELNNSIEDNVFRIVSTGAAGKNRSGFQRFCSAGTSVLVYPYEKIVEMLALEKASAILSEQWMLIDKEFSYECQRAENMRKQGKYLKRQSKESFYINFVEEQKMSLPFVKKIYMDSVTEIVQEDGDPYEKENWNAYWEALEQAVDQWNESNTKLSERINNFGQMIRLYSSYRNYRTKDFSQKLRETMDGLVLDCKKDLEQKKSMAGNRFFGVREDADENDAAYYRTWLKKDKYFIHPNAIRYFLYKTIEMFQNKHEELVKRINSEEDVLQSSIDRVSDKLKLSSNAVLNDIFYRSELDKIRRSMEVGLDTMNSYRRNVLLAELTEKGAIVLKRLAEEYEAFYDVFSQNIERYIERAENIKRSLQDVNGTITRYVGCDEKTLDYMKGLTIDTRNDVEIAGEVSELIFSNILEKMNTSYWKFDYHTVFQEVFIQNWQEDLRRNYRHILDLDILEALDREWKCRADRESTSEVYIRDKIDLMWTLASPFIGMSDKQMELTKDFCTYSSLLREKREKSRSRILQRLDERGGTTDAEGAVDQYTIVFYQVVYGLEPGSIKEMSIQWDAFKYEYSMGSMAKSYYEMLKNTGYSRMTPHIDWNWNRFDILPDFNESYQYYLENVTYKMFLYQCVLHLDQATLINEEQRYCLAVDGRTNYAKTLYQLLIDKFINNLEQVFQWNRNLEKEIETWIGMGRKAEEFPFLVGIDRWGKWLEGVWGLVYHTNTDGGIDNYDNGMVRNMVYAFIDLVWEILAQFYMESQIGKKLEVILQKHKDFFAKSGKNEFVLTDIKLACSDKLKEKGISGTML